MLTFRNKLSGKVISKFYSNLPIENWSIEFIKNAIYTRQKSIPNSKYILVRCIPNVIRFH